MVELAEAANVKIGLAATWCARADTIVERMAQMFDENRWVMLENPPQFRPGEIPMDGQTGALRQYYNRPEPGKAIL
jgi:hypothetical protein